MDIGENGHPTPKIKSNRKYLIDTMSIKAPRANMNVQSYLKDGLIDDWDALEKVLEYTFGKHLKCDPSKHPILVSEPVVSFKCYLV
jgi:actin-like protein 6B